MGFAAPLFLLSALAVALPLLLHRMRTESSERREFASAMFLQAAPQPEHRQRRLRYRGLLALRIALIGLLALLFAQPFLRGKTAGAAAGLAHHYIVIDVSASMQRDAAIGTARDLAVQLVDALADGESARILVAADRLQAITDLSSDRAILRNAIAGVNASPARLDIGPRMRDLDALLREDDSEKSVHIISDFQASGAPLRFSDLVPATAVELNLHPVPAPRGNRSIEYLRERDGSARIGVRLDGTASSGDRVRVSVNEAVVETRELAATEHQELLFSLPPLREGSNRILAELVNGDELAIDDRRYAVVEGIAQREIPLLSESANPRSAVFLEAALEAATDSLQLRTVRYDDFDSRTLARFPWVIVDDVGSLNAALEAALRQYLQNGGRVLALSGARSVARETLPLSGHRLAAASASTAGVAVRTIFVPDASHPLLRDTEGWTAATVLRSIPIVTEPADVVVLALSDSSPFLVERHHGDGTQLLLLAALDRDWTDLPAQPVFVALVSAIARYLEPDRRGAVAALAGDALPLSVRGSASGQVIDPDGLELLELHATGVAQSIGLDKTGFYEVHTNDASWNLAVNVDPRESRIGTMSPQLLARWTAAATAAGSPARTGAPANAGSIDENASPIRSLWPALLIALCLCVLAETLLANRHLRSTARTA